MPARFRPHLCRSVGRHPAPLRRRRQPRPKPGNQTTPLRLLAPRQRQRHYHSWTQSLRAHLYCPRAAASSLRPRQSAVRTSLSRQRSRSRAHFCSYKKNKNMPSSSRLSLCHSGGRRQGHPRHRRRPRAVRETQSSPCRRSQGQERR